MNISKWMVLAMAAGGLMVSARAGSVVLEMQNGNDSGGYPFNTTLFTIHNTSGGGAALTGFHMTIGDMTFNFDSLYLSEETFIGGNGSQTATLTLGDRFDGNSIVTDAFNYTFNNFTPGIAFRGQFDIDHDSGVFVADARHVLFNNGNALNAVATFTFSDGSSLEYTFPDMPIRERYSLTVPDAGALGVAALGALAMLAGCRAKKGLR